MSASTSLEPVAIEAAPGGVAVARLRIRNTGAIVDRFDVTVVGPAAGWTSVEPASSSLFPGQEATIVVRFAPPRAPTVRAATLPFGVRVAPAANPAGATVDEGRVTVLPYHEPAAEIVPQTSRGSRTGHHEVMIANRGNTPATVTVTASDPDRLLAFAVEPAQVTIEPGDQATVRVAATAHESFLRGAARQIPFSVEVRGAGAAPVLLRGAFRQQATMPGWLAPAAGLAAVAVVAAVVLPGILWPPPPLPPGGGDGTPSPGIATPDPSAAVTPGTTDGASPGTTPDGTGEPSPDGGTTPPAVTPPPAPTAPSAQIRFRFQLEDVLFRGSEVGRDKVNPKFAFATFGPGDVRVTVRDVTGDQGGGVTVCLGPEGARPRCETVTSSGFVAVANDAAGERRWAVTAEPGLVGAAPNVDLVFAFHTLRPEFTLRDNGTFNDSYSQFTWVVTAGEQSELRMDFAFSGLSSWWWYGPRDVDTFGSPPPLMRGGPSVTWTPPIVNLANGRSYEFRWEGEGTQTSDPIDYEVVIRW